MEKKPRRVQGDAIEFARRERRTANEFSHTVWQWLRNRRMLGLKFRREHPIPPYTVDFCNLELRLIIEVDGYSHLTPAGIRHDTKRDQFLSELGYRVLRVAGYEVISADKNARVRIEQWVRLAITTH